MFLLYFLDTYINMVKYLQRVTLDVSINWPYLHQDVRKTWITWIGDNATRYHNFNVLPHALLYIFSQFNKIGHNGMRYHNFNILPHAFSYIFSQFSMVWGLFATGHHALLYINIQDTEYSRNWVVLIIYVRYCRFK